MSSSAPKAAAAPDNINPGEKLKLWVSSGGRCALCNKYLLHHEHTTMPIPIGEMAHNVGRVASKNSPRGDHPLAVDHRNLAENLLLLCPEDHAAIDKKLGQEEFPVERLREIKSRHDDRIRRLTALTDNDRTVVIRMVGDVRGTSPTVDGATVRLTVATDGKYPRYDLGSGIESDIEIDLRHIAGEGEDVYWAAVERKIVDVVGIQLGQAIARGNVGHVSVFGFARIPALVVLGHHLDDKTATSVYQFHQGTWAWPEDRSPVGFAAERVTGAAGDAQVGVLCSISGTIDRACLPKQMAAGAVYELSPDGEMPSRDLFRSATTLENFAGAWRGLLSRIEAEHPAAERVDLVPAVPLSAAIEIGRNRTREVHPPLRVWDRDGDTYSIAVEIKP